MSEVSGGPNLDYVGQDGSCSVCFSELLGRVITQAGDKAGTTSHGVHVVCTRFWEKRRSQLVY